MGDMRFDRCILLADNSPDALDWSSLPREWRRPDFLPETRLPLAGDTLGYIICSACVYPRATAAPGAYFSSSNKHRKKQAAAASSSCETSPADMAHAGMAPCRRLTQTDLACCSLLRISTTTIRLAAQSQLHGNGQGSTVTRRRSGEGQERGGVLCTNPARAAAAAASVAASKRCCKSKHNACLLYTSPSPRDS